jgi:hypothetical protein
LVEIYSLQVSFSSVERKRVLMINAGGSEFTFWSLVLTDLKS